MQVCELWKQLSNHRKKVAVVPLAKVKWRTSPWGAKRSRPRHGVTMATVGGTKQKVVGVSHGPIKGVSRPTRCLAVKAELGRRRMSGGLAYIYYIYIFFFLCGLPTSRMNSQLLPRWLLFYLPLVKHLFYFDFFEQICGRGTHTRNSY